MKKRIISFLLVMAMVLSMAPAIELQVGAETISVPIEEFGKLGFLGHGFNMLGNTEFKNEHISNKSIFRLDVTKEQLNRVSALYTGLSDDVGSYLYITDMSSYMQKETMDVEFSFGLDISSLLKFEALFVGAECKVGATGEWEWSEAQEHQYAIYECLAMRDKYYMDLSATRYIQRLWDENMLSEDFILDITDPEFSPKVVFEKYGTHIITSYVSGGEMNMVYRAEDLSEASKSATNDETNVKIPFITSDSAFSESEEYASAASYADFWITYRGGTGRSDVSVGDMANGTVALSDWQSSVDENAEILINDSLSFIPIWELLVGEEYAALREELESYYYAQMTPEYIKLYEQCIYTPEPDEGRFEDYTFITSAQQLDEVRNDLDGHYVLCCDLDLKGAEWTPIGTSDAPFTGTFDGNGATISGLSVTKCTDGAAGLFGYVGTQGKIRNLRVAGAVDVDATGSANNLAYVGGIVGYNKGLIENCMNLVTVNGKITVTEENNQAPAEEEHLQWDYDAILAKLTDANTYDLSTFTEDEELDMDAVTVVKLTGTTTKAVNLKLSKGTVPLYIILEDAQFSGNNSAGTISAAANCARPVWIISKGTNNSISNSNYAAAISVPSAALTIVGEGNLTIIGADGKNGSGYLSDGTGQTGGTGNSGVVANSLTVDMEAVLTIVGGNGGIGATGKAGTNGANKTGSCTAEWGSASYEKCSGATGGNGGDGNKGGEGGKGATAVTLKGNAGLSVCGITRVYLISGDGGTGGTGGVGGNGGYGQKGGNAWIATVGHDRGHNGGAGGKGGNGGTGGNGGGAGGTYSGNLEINGSADVMLVNGNQGAGGTGGRGGAGGAGGDGGKWNAGSWITGHLFGGKGGTGGAAGNGGKGGDGYVAGVGGAAGTVGTGGMGGCNGSNECISDCSGRRGRASSGATASKGSAGAAKAAEALKATLKTATKEYAIYNQAITHTDASGHSLVSIGSQAEQALIERLAEIGGQSEYWIGLRWDVTKGRWVWNDGNEMYVPNLPDCEASDGKYEYGNCYDEFDEIVFSNWKPNQPSYTHAENGITYLEEAVLLQTASGCQWNDARSNTSRSGYITEVNIGQSLELDITKNAVFAGGIAGFNDFEAKIVDCINYADVCIDKATSENGAIAAVAGGIAGYNKNKVDSCYNTGVITAKAKSNAMNGYALAYAMEISMEGEITNCKISNTNAEKNELCYALAKSANDLDNNGEGVMLNVAGTEENERVTKNVQYWENARIGITFGDEADYRANLKYVVDDAFDESFLTITFDGNVVEGYVVRHFFLTTGGKLVRISYDDGQYYRTIPVIVSECDHANTTEAVVTAPTCTEGGYTTYTCTKCGHSYVDDYVDALDHSEEILPGKDATCTETGLTEGKKCSVCGETLVEQEVIAALGHSEEILPGKDATCTETGLTEGKKCSVCGETLVAQEVIAVLGHRYETVVTAPTCTEQGYTTYTCACGYSYVDDYVDALGHSEEILPGKDATCTETGLTEGKKCSVCGEILMAQEVIAALGHNYEPVVTEPTYTTQGYTTHTCVNCGDSYVDSYTAPLVPETDVKVTVGTVSGNAGDTVEVYLTLEKAPALKILAISQIVYDTEHLTFVSGQWLRDDSFTDTFSKKNMNGLQLFEENTDVNGEIFKMTFTINADAPAGEYAVSCVVTAKQTDENGDDQDVLIAMESGKVIVKDYLLGDADGNEKVNTDDAIYLLYNIMFGDGDYPVNQKCDFDGNGKVNTDDAIYLLYHIMFGETDYPLHG